jgi:hypothetical protein
MIGALFRVVAGFVVASLAAGLAFVLFAVPPSELASAKSPGLGAVADWALKAGTQAAIFSAPFALIAAAIGEWQRLRSPAFYGVSGLLIAVAGFLAQRSSEATGQETVLNPYAGTAFLASGLVAGLVYWLIAGRVAGDEDAEDEAVAALPQPGAEPAEPAAKPAESKPAQVEPAAAAKAAPVHAAEAKPAAAKADEPKPAEAKAPEPKPADEKRAAGRPAGLVESAKAAIDETLPRVTDPEVKA